MAITAMEEKLIRALAKYKYLTITHIISLGISQSKASIRSYLLRLSKGDKYKMVGRQIHYAVLESVKKKGLITKQRQDYLHYLTAVGANFLNDFTELCLSDIRYPKNPKLYLSNDYNHRVSMIHIHISFDKRIEKIESLKSKFLVYYNQAIGSKKQRFESETCIPVQKGKNFSPDGICSYLNRVGEPTIFCIEVYNGDRVKYAVEQLEKLFWIVEKTDKIETKIGVKAIPRILCICNNIKLLKGIVERMRENKAFRVDGIEHLIFFNLDVNVWKVFGKGWVNLKGERIDLENVKPFKGATD